MVAVGSGGGGYGGSPNAYTQSDDPTIPADSRTYGYGNDWGAGSGSPNFGGGGGGAGGAGTIVHHLAVQLMQMVVQDYPQHPFLG